MKYLKVHIEGKYVGTDEVSYHRLDGSETLEDLDAIAREQFEQYAEYGHEVVDEDEVDEGDR